jgi:transcriptional regulator with PAS, ATPase and Fis domain
MKWGMGSVETELEVGGTEYEVREDGGDEIIGVSAAIRGILSVIQRVADSDSTVVIYGETGAGKDLIARAIHRFSRRRSRPFVTINCGAIPETLLESELFGHMKGAFTGALSRKEGKFELADRGTVFLDEIGDMSRPLQVKLLRVLETRSFEPLGGSKTVHVDVRIIAATHRDLRKAITEGTFREDLFYRLHVIPLRIPPLRDRREDIPLLLNHFIAHFNRARGMKIEGVTRAASQCLVAYSWPGNVRELKNTVERLVVLKGEGYIDLDDLPSRLRSDGACPAKGLQIRESGISLATAVEQFEKELILQSLEKTSWVKNRAAELLHLKRTTLVEKIKRHGLTKP